MEDLAIQIAGDPVDHRVASTPFEVVDPNRQIVTIVRLAEHMVDCLTLLYA